MTVIATAKGYYGGRIIEAGEPVPIAKGAKLASWMTEVDAPAPEKPAKGGPDTEVTAPEKPAKGKDAITGDEI